MKSKTKKLSGISAGIMLSVCVSFLVCVYAPFELYLTNISDFPIKPSELLIPSLVTFFVCCTVFSCVLIIARLINEKLYGVCLTAELSLLISMYIQGTFLIKNLPATDGTTVNWSEYPKERLASIFVFIIPLIVLTFVLIKFKTIIIKQISFIAGICFTLLFSVTLVSLFLTTNLNKPENLSCTVKNEFEMSDEKNLIVLILDATDNNYFKRQMQSDKELEEMLDGFTYFDNALSTYAFTNQSLPMIFSGNWYDYKTNFNEYRKDSVVNSPFINKLEQSGYKIGIYEAFDIKLDANKLEQKLDNCSPCILNLRKLGTYNLILKMTAVKFGPWDVKRFVWNISNTAYNCLKSDSGYSKFDWSDKIFYNSISNSNPIKTTQQKCAKIIHLEGAHVPLQYDKNLNIVKNGTYEGNIDACITLIKTYLTRLKESGVYDNSAIMILADHGWSGDEKTDNYQPEKRVNPMLMVKGTGESHTLKYSSAPILYTDIADGITNLIDGKPSSEIFPFADGDKRTRRFILSNYNSDKMRETLTDGRADDTQSMKETGTVYKFKK